MVTITPLEIKAGSRVLQDKLGWRAVHDAGHTGTELNIAQDLAVENLSKFGNLLDDLRDQVSQNNLGGVEALLPKFDKFASRLGGLSALLTKAYFYFRSASHTLVNYFSTLMRHPEQTPRLNLSDERLDLIVDTFANALRTDGIELKTELKYNVGNMTFRTDIDSVKETIVKLKDGLKSIDPNLKILIQADYTSTNSRPPLQIVFQGHFPWKVFGDDEGRDLVNETRRELINLASQVREVSANSDRDLKAITVELTNLYHPSESLDDLKELHANLNVA